MLGAGGVGGDVGQVDFGLHRRGELDLGLFGRFLQTLQRQLVLGQVDALFLLELAGEIFDQAHVEVFAAQERVAVGRFHFEDAVADLEDRNVEGAAAEVVDGDRARLLLVEAVGERRRGRLVDDAQHFEAGDLAGVLGRLALGVVEIGGHRDDGLRHRRSQMRLGGLLHLLQHEGGNLRRRILLAVRRHPGVAVGGLDDLIGDEAHVLLGHGIVERPADQPLDGEKGALGIGHALALGGLADQTLAVVGEGDDRGGRARALGILDDLRGRPFHDRDAGIGRSKVDADNFSHCPIPHCFARPRGPEAAWPWKRAMPAKSWLAMRVPVPDARFQTSQERRSCPNAAQVARI